MAKKTPKTKKTVETLTHDEASRRNIPTAEYQSVMAKEQQSHIRVALERRNRDLDPQLVWRGKDEQDWSDLVVHAAPLYIQEKVHPKVLIDDLLRRSKADAKAADAQLDLFADFNGLPSESARTEFYQHDANWSNRMILGDSLQVMASLAEREGLRGKVQCIYIDPPYGIKFNSNFQWSTTSRDPGGFSGCGTIYKAARDERSLGTFVDDESIEVKIKGRLFDDEQVKWFDISVYCFMGEVFLVGVVEQEAQRVRAVDLAKGVAGVKSVTTYILDKGKDRTTGKSLDDVTVTAKVKAKLNRRQRPEILPDRRKDRQGSCGIVRNRFDPGGDPKGDCPCQAGGGGPEDQVVRDDPLIEGLDPCPQWVWVCPFLGGVSRHEKKATEIFLL